MRRFLSWVVLYLASCLTSVITSISLTIGAYLFDLIDTLNVFLKIVIYIIGGSVLLSFLILPIYYGTALTIYASEAIKESKKGTRYIAFGMIMLILSLLYIFYGIAKDTFHIGCVIMSIYYIALIISGKHIVDERY